jgi:hypothetical protein
MWRKSVGQSSRAMASSAVAVSTAPNAVVPGRPLLRPRPIATASIVAGRGGVQLGPRRRQRRGRGPARADPLHSLADKREEEVREEMAELRCEERSVEMETLVTLHRGASPPGRGRRRGQRRRDRPRDVLQPVRARRQHRGPRAPRSLGDRAAARGALPPRGRGQAGRDVRRRGRVREVREALELPLTNPGLFTRAPVRAARHGQDHAGPGRCAPHQGGGRSTASAGWTSRAGSSARAPASCSASRGRWRRPSIVFVDEADSVAADREAQRVCSSSCWRRWTGSTACAWRPVRRHARRLRPRVSRRRREASVRRRPSRRVLLLQLNRLASLIQRHSSATL